MKKPPNNSLPDDFDPSPFKDSKDDLNHALEDIKIFKEHFSSYYQKVKQFQWQQKFAAAMKQNVHKYEEIPIMFLRVHEVSLLSEIPERSVFTALLRRENKEIVLGFAYDWLVTQGMIHPMVLKNEFIVSYWNDHFENIVI